MHLSEEYSFDLLRPKESKLSGSSHLFLTDPRIMSGLLVLHE